MTKAELIKFIKDNFMVDSQGNLMYILIEDTPAIITHQQIEWLVKQGIETDQLKPTPDHAALWWDYVHGKITLNQFAKKAGWPTK